MEGLLVHKGARVEIGVKRSLPNQNPSCLDWIRFRDGAGEAFCPVCLPGYNPEAFLHAYIDYLDREAGLYLVLLAGR